MKSRVFFIYTNDYKGVREVIDLHLTIRIERLVRRDFEFA
jgi:hypothetical protein